MPCCVCVCVSGREGPTRHADAGVVSNAVKAGAVVVAGCGGTLVDVQLTAWASVPAGTVTAEGAVSVHTVPPVFTGLWTCTHKLPSVDSQDI